MSPRVFIPQEVMKRDRETGNFVPRLDLGSATEFGTIVVLSRLFPGPMSMDGAALVDEIQRGMEGFYPDAGEPRSFDDDDYLVAVGTPTAIAVAAAVAANLNDGRIRMLYWNGMENRYIEMFFDTLA